MTVRRVRDLLDGEVIVDPGTLDAVEIAVAGAADLMSDVLVRIEPGALLLTGLTNAHSVRTAIVSDISAIVFVRDKAPDPKAIELARTQRLPLLKTRLTLYEACGRLFAAGIRGCGTKEPAERIRDATHKGV